MHSRVVKLWFAVRTTVFDDAGRAALGTEATDHWLAQLPLALQLLSPNLSDVAVEVREAPDTVMQGLTRLSDSVLLQRLFSTVCVTTVVTIDETARVHPKNTDPPSEEFWPGHLSFHLVKAFEIATVALELSRPGCLLFTSGLTFIDDQPIEEVAGRFPLSSLDSHDDLSNKWPKLWHLDLVDVVRWLKLISAFSPPVATTRLQRTFASFTYLASLKGDGGEALFRAMQGLEAFYCDGVGDLRKQLADKTLIWLGLKDDPANTVGKLYDLRSKYVHGSARMPYAIAVEDADEHSPAAMAEFYAGVEMATRLLIATLQKCVISSIEEISWGYSVSAKARTVAPT